MDADRFYMRNPGLVVVTGPGNVLLTGSEGKTVEHPTGEPAEWSRLMQALAAPIQGRRLEQLCATLPEPDRAFLHRSIKSDFVSHSRDGDVLLNRRNEGFNNSRAFQLAPRETACEHMVLACTGSIVAGLMGPSALSLFYSGFSRTIEVVLTDAACRFVTSDFFESYGFRTWVDAFARRDGIHVPHVHLARSTNCVLVMPASANSLHRLAAAACTDLLSLLVAATQAPVILAPAMNEAMWNSPGVQRNAQRLRDDGMYIIEPTLILGAADLADRGRAMYGGPGTLWLGPGALMDVVASVLQCHARRQRRGSESDESEAARTRPRRMP